MGLSRISKTVSHKFIVTVYRGSDLVTIALFSKPKMQITQGRSVFVLKFIVTDPG